MFSFISDHSAAKAISFGLLAITGLTYSLFLFHSRKLQELESKIADLDSISSKAFKSLEKVLVKGTTIKKTLNSSARNHSKYLLKRKSKSFLDTRFKTTKSTDQVIGSNFILGRKVPIKVKLDALKVFEGKLAKEVTTATTESFFQQFFGLFEADPFYVKVTSHVLPVESVVYIKGTVIKPKLGKTIILAKKVFTSKESFLHKYSSRVRDSKMFLFGCLLACLTFCLSIKVLSYKDPEEPSGLKCSECSGAASIIIYPCNHLTYCRSCLLLKETCSSCGNFINSHIQITS